MRLAPVSTRIRPRERCFGFSVVGCDIASVSSRLGQSIDRLVRALRPIVTRAPARSLRADVARFRRRL